MVGAAALHNVNWFYPALTIVVGAHYLPFVFLYGLWHYAVLAGILIFGGLGIGLVMPQSFTPAGWMTVSALLLFSAWFASIREKPAA
ncbi:MAG TPA: hypothetical protein VEY91_13695 [Candidatus Limnocylindria bacterium]|nr:hypothetical protein [Candidatus Limnocylindria bacterium]